MSGFFELREGARKKIILIVVLLLLAGGITIYFQRDRLSSPDVTGFSLKCRSCNHTETVSEEQFQAMTNQQNESYIQIVAQQDPQKAVKLRQLMENPDQAMDPMSRREIDVSLPSWGTRDWPLSCPECKKNALFNAIKCPNCEEIFFGQSERGHSIRTCPKCKYNLKSKK